MQRILTCILTSLGLLLTSTASEAAGRFDCNLVYDEFDSLMNRNFLVQPESYVKVAVGKLSREQYNNRQKDKLVLRPGREGSGVVIVKTNNNKYGKFLFTWGGKGDVRGNPLLILRDVTTYRRVKDGYGKRVRREIRIPASMTADLDSGLTGQGDKDDVWFHIVDNNNMYVEAVNGAKLTFPLESLCK